MLELIKTSLEHKILPPANPSAKIHPALFLLHGRGSNEDDLLGLAPYLDPRFFMIAVRAPFQFPYGGFTWYDTPEAGSPEPGEFEQSYDRLMQCIEAATMHYPIDAGRLFLMGFSMGTVMSYAIALTRPDLIRGVVANSGYIPEGVNLSFRWDRLKGKGFFVAHGVHDPVIGIETARRAKEMLLKAEADLTYREYPIAHSMSEESIDDVSRWLRQRLEPGGRESGKQKANEN